jgi:hypothetical protein
MLPNVAVVSGWRNKICVSVNVVDRVLLKIKLREPCEGGITTFRGTVESGAGSLAG